MSYMIPETLLKHVYASRSYSQPTHLLYNQDLFIFAQVENYIEAYHDKSC